MTRNCHEIRVCENCNNQYLARKIDRRFCSMKCMYVWRSALIRSKPKKSKSPRKYKILDTGNCLICKKQFHILENRKIFCSIKCRHNWRTLQSWIDYKCKNCGIIFRERKNYRHPRTGKGRQYCSNKCSATSLEKQEALRRWGKSNKNHLFIAGFQKKMSLSNSKKISKLQQKVYNEIKLYFQDAILEKWLDDVKKSIDIFIPSINKVIEVYGDYWHANPLLFNPTDINQHNKKLAEDIWATDKVKIDLLIKNGYLVDILWEREISKIKN